MEDVKGQSKKRSLLEQHNPLRKEAWDKPWVVYCEPSFRKPEHVIKYLGPYTHRVAITNQRIINIDQKNVSFMHKDYRKFN